MFVRESPALVIQRYVNLFGAQTLI